MDIASAMSFKRQISDNLQLSKQGKIEIPKNIHYNQMSYNCRMLFSNIE